MSRVVSISLPWNTSVTSKCLVWHDKYITLYLLSKMMCIGEERLRVLIDNADILPSIPENEGYSEFITLDTINKLLRDTFHKSVEEREARLHQLNPKYDVKMQQQQQQQITYARKSVGSLRPKQTAASIDIVTPPQSPKEARVELASPPTPPMPLLVEEEEVNIVSPPRKRDREEEQEVSPPPPKGGAAEEPVQKKVTFAPPPPKGGAAASPFPNYVNDMIQACHNNIMAQAIIFMQSTSQWTTAFDAKYEQAYNARKQALFDQLMKREEEAVYKQMLEEELNKTLPVVQQAKQSELCANYSRIVELSKKDLPSLM